MRCHYCPSKATTKDHIVPKSLIDRSGFTNLQNEANTVPACYPCNQKKSNYRSDCDCDQCIRAWVLLGPLNPRVPIPIVSLLGRSRQHADD